MNPPLVSLADVAAVPCPYCGAPAGQDCRTARTRTRPDPGTRIPAARPHGRRWDAARQLHAKEPR